ncbi:gamma-tubulin complex component 6 isoform X2 [Rhinopithecus roxellana]|uniref:gamma-tubulin complex component 6 isoform X2 n=1 Tax=Rhinopithecus roxellana TaxID=61622 RepID=UPI001237653C|nr:gamma-tubulin complex component 6 isoform X2 [Rhinopithecus roxellana]
MASITQLFDDLCEALLPAAKTHLGQRSVNRKTAKRNLKKVAYSALFTNLFQDETQQLQLDMSKLPARNKILMLSFDLRVGGRGPEADRLEELVEELEAAPCCPLLEVGSVLDLLVQLAGSGPPQLLRRNRDYFLNNKHVGRNVPYSGYDCDHLSVFETDVQSLISREECLCHSMIQETLQVMEAAPGTGLPTVGLFSFGDPCGDRFERDTRVSLFGALVHSRTYDMDVRLGLPPVPDNADLSGLAIKVPPNVDQWEDEGFQSASNLTPDSQSEPSMTPDVDLWEAALTYEASKRRCWERVGCPPGHREEPYLTEAGRDAFDKFCRLRQGELQLLAGGVLQAAQPVLVKECELVKDVLNVLIGVVSATFSLCQPAQAFVVKRGVHVSGASPESISSLLSEVAEYGTCYTRLSHFSLQPVLDSSYSKGLVFQAFTSGLRRYLQYYRACVLSTSPTLSLLTIGFLFKKLGRQLRYLAELCGVGAVLPGTCGGGPRAAFPTGVKLLSYLYQEALHNCSNEHYPVLLSLLKTSCEPYTRFIHDWVYSGVFRDAYGEFMIQVNHEYLSFRDKSYWTHGYVLISKEVEDCVPVFLKHIAHDVYVCGKTINLLKLCCPRHYLCWSDVPVPRISVIFSLEELKEIEKDCAVYVGRMERVARHSSVSKEEKELRMEIAKQELIAHAREAASRVLSALSDRQMSERMALDARKREQFQRLKEQFVKDQERRQAARQEELEDDFSYARELRDRERRLKSLEEELERKARQALVDHYSKLSAEAARREQKALWRIQRHRLESARLRFLLEDEKHVQERAGGSRVCSRALSLPCVPPNCTDTGGEELVVLKYFLQAQGPSGAQHKPCLVQYTRLPWVVGAVLDSSSAGHPSDLNLQEMLKAMSEGHQPQEPPDVLSVHPQVTSLGPEHQEGDQGCDAGPAEQHLAAWDGRNRPGLLTPQSLKPLAMGAGGTGLQQAEEAGPFSDSLSIGDFLPVGPGAEQSVQTGMVPLLEAALQTINLDLPPSAPGEAPAAASTQPSRPQEYDFSTVLRPAAAASPAPGPLKAAECNLGSSGPQLWEDSCGKLDACGSTLQVALSPSHPPRRATPKEGSSQPTEQLFGHESGGGLPTGGCASEIALTRPQWNIHRHVSDASIRVGENVSQVAPARPRWNTHGHVSDASISLGESVSEVAPTRPRWNIHGHVSDASIRVGENVSDVAPTRPRWNAHGHVSDASISLGEPVSDVVSTRPRWNAHGHVSDASISLGEPVSDVAPTRPRWNIHGHVSDASISLGESVSEVAPTRPRWNTRASVPPPHMMLGAVSPEAGPNTPAPQQSPPGHTSQSVLSPGAQSTVLDCGPRLPVELGPSLSSPSSGCGEGSISIGENVSDVAPTWPWLPNTPGDSVSEELGPGRSGDAEEPLNSQENAAAQSSLGPGEEAAVAAEARGSEQAYLAGLAGQYHLERYPDSYESMSEPPIAHLLRPVLPRAFAFPVDPQVQSAADETAVQLSELLTLPVLMKHSIMAPLAAHISLVNKAAVDYFFVELHLEAHYEALRHFLLMEDGEFAQSLSDLLFEKVTSGHGVGPVVEGRPWERRLAAGPQTHGAPASARYVLGTPGDTGPFSAQLGAGQTPGELLNPLVLNSVLSKALQCSLHGDTPHASNLSLALKYLPEVFAPNAPDVLSCLELRYKVDWPLNVVITEGCLSKYSGVFSFLLQLKLMMWALKDICFHLKRTALLSHMASSVQFRQLQLFKHEMQHFVKVIQGYIANQILHVTWCEFRARLATVGDLEEIQRAHAEYLHKAVFRGLLTEKAAPVMNVIHSIFSLVLKFRSQLISQAWGPAGGPRGAEHPNFALMQQSYNTFKYYSHFLFKVVTKLVNRGYQPHLEDFLLRINFNNYYQDT